MDWLTTEGWSVRRGHRLREADVVATRGAEELRAEVKGETTSCGLDADTAWGQFLRRMTGEPGVSRPAPFTLPAGRSSQGCLTHPTRLAR